jgi:orotate phosphoribosyltransferase-like protein
VINVGTLSKLRSMVRRDGLSVREASKRLGIARNTAARWLAMDEMVEPKYPKRVSGTFAVQHSAQSAPCSIG